VVEFNLKVATTIELTELKKRSWIEKYTLEGNLALSFPLILDKVYFISKV